MLFLRYNFIKTCPYFKMMHLHIQNFSGRKGNFGEIINVPAALDVKSTNTDRWVSREMKMCPNCFSANECCEMIVGVVRNSHTWFLLLLHFFCLTQYNTTFFLVTYMTPAATSLLGQGYTVYRITKNDKMFSSKK